MAPEWCTWTTALAPSHASSAAAAMGKRTQSLCCTACCPAPWPPPVADAALPLPHAERMTLLDLRAAVSELRTKLIGLRVANVYDVSTRTYLLKFSRPGTKFMLLVESGTRIHTTQFTRDKSTIPSGFSMKLRKHIRTRRLEAIEQLGADRILKMTFGSGEAQYHLIVELYDRGNIVLVDREHTILSLLRAHKHDSTVNMSMVVGEAYPLDGVSQIKRFGVDELIANLEKGAAAGDPALKQHLSGTTDVGPALVEHCLLQAGIPGKTKCSQVLTTMSDSMSKIVAAFDEAYAILEQAGAEGAPKGHIALKARKITPPLASDGGDDQCDSATGETEDREFTDITPVLLAQHDVAGLDFQHFESFDEALDQYFSKADMAKFTVTAEKSAKTALSKKDKVRIDHEKRIHALQHAQESSLHIAHLIESNMNEVDAAIEAVASLVASGMDWAEVATVVKEERKKGNPVAELILSLNLEQNRMTLLLSVNLDDASEEELSKPASKVGVDLSMSALANAGVYYRTKKKSAAKEAKTAAATGGALKAAGKKGDKAMVQVDRDVGQGVQHTRKAMWFEKFDWFISSEDILVLAGRDAQQNELLVKRYLKRGDAYVHADLHGAASCIVKNPSKAGAPIPATTLSQAGAMTTCRSAAWASNTVTSAWWVEASQVSKTAPTGEYLSTGSFMIRGKKNFLPPNPLVMGLAFLFVLEEGSIARHLGERRKTAGDGENDGIDTQSTSEASAEERAGSKANARMTEKVEANVEAKVAPVPQPQPEPELEPEPEPEPEPEREPEPDLEVTDLDDDDDDADADAALLEIAADSVKQDGSTPSARLASLPISGTKDADVEGDGSEPGTASDTHRHEANKPAKRYMTARERRVQRKLKTGNDSADQAAEATDSQAVDEESGVEAAKMKEDNNNDNNKSQPTSTHGSAQPKPKTESGRGTNGKKKKLKGKYADQDDDERALRMQLLGHKPQEQPQAQERTKIRHPPAKTRDSEQWTPEEKADFHAKNNKANSAAGPDSAAETTDAAQGRAEARVAAKSARAEESEGVAEILKEEGLLDVDSMQQLDALVRIFTPCSPLFCVDKPSLLTAQLLLTGYNDRTARSGRYCNVCRSDVRAVDGLAVVQVQGACCLLLPAAAYCSLICLAFPGSACSALSAYVCWCAGETGAREGEEGQSCENDPGCDGSTGRRYVYGIR